ncbi:MAG: chemotaxis protein CheY [Myxococcaceae bacterium]|nr:chemotaxis protein CheY [Myxococcaceae bacterium]
MPDWHQPGCSCCEVPVPPARPKVLVVDDSAAVRAEVLGWLRADYDCLEATNGAEGFRCALEQAPDAIVTDLEMPVLDGVGLLRMLHANPASRAIPVVVITTVTEVEQVNLCRSLGCAAFVLKPVEGAYLLAKLRQLLP